MNLGLLCGLQRAPTPFQTRSAMRRGLHPGALLKNLKLLQNLYSGTTSDAEGDARREMAWTRLREVCDAVAAQAKSGLVLATKTPDATKGHRLSTFLKGLRDPAACIRARRRRTR